MNNQDIFFIKETLRLAKKAQGWTNPNPMVGAVILKNGEIIGKGYHKKAGLAHAEVEALQSVETHSNKSLQYTQGATLYVNLEPCAHYGKVPPCVDTIIRSGISKVVCSMIDPNPKVQGKGIRVLQEAGIEVTVGVLEQEARRLNEAFITFHEKKRPFIALKFATSLDGKIATKTGDSKWITNEQARRAARVLRGEYQSVLIGINTVLHDNPHLGTRIAKKKDPLRIILDSSLKIPLESQVLRNSNVLIITTTQADKKKQELLMNKGISVISCGDEHISLELLLAELTKREIISVLVEGGGTIHGSFVDARLADKIYAFYAPLLVGGKDAITAVEGNGASTISEAMQLKNITFKHFGDCFMVYGYT